MANEQRASTLRHRSHTASSEPDTPGGAQEDARALSRDPMSPAYRKASSRLTDEGRLQIVQGMRKCSNLDTVEEDRRKKASRSHHYKKISHQEWEILVILFEMTGWCIFRAYELSLIQISQHVPALKGLVDPMIPDARTPKRLGFLRVLAVPQNLFFFVCLYYLASTLVSIFGLRGSMLLVFVLVGLYRGFHIGRKRHLW